MTRISVASYDRFMHASTFICTHGPMDKLSDYGSEDSRVNSWRGRYFLSIVLKRELDGRLKTERHIWLGQNVFHLVRFLING